MGKDTKGDRKPNKPSSSARAAETLASKAAAGVGVGFGGYEMLLNLVAIVEEG